MEPWNNLEGKVVMVTGASSGFGTQLCVDLAKAGCKVIAAARRTNRLKSLCEEINHSADASEHINAPKSGGIAVAVELDVAGDGEAIKMVVENAWKCFGRIDALVNNAGARALQRMEPWSNLEGKVVMVTGASSGLGRELCVDLAKAGCKVIAAARRTNRLKSLCEEINHYADANELIDAPKFCGITYRAAAVELDVAGDGEAIKMAVENAWKCFGRIDALVNNAGVRGGVKSPLELSEEEWNNVVRTNLTGSWLVSKYVGLLMVEAVQEGCIINISSSVGLNRTYPKGALAYGSSKTGLNSLTKIMALELGKHNIRVNSISPDIFLSEITESLMKKKWLKKVAERTVPLKAFITPDPALTSLVRYLIHDSSKYVTGNIFIVDAGITLPSLPIFSSL